MPRVAGEKQYNSFVKGLITEASPLTFPENAFLDGANIVLNRDGSISRRLGVDYEEGYTKTDVGYASTLLFETEKSFHSWAFAGGDSSVSLGVVRVKDKLYFLDMTSTSPSSNLKNGGVPLVVAGLDNAPIETTVINNGLVLVSSDLKYPVFLEYNVTDDEVSLYTLYLKVRDFWGIEDGLAVDERPGNGIKVKKRRVFNIEPNFQEEEPEAGDDTLSIDHRYNLLNQGWPSAYIAEVKANRGYYPSNADVWTLGKKSDSEFNTELLFKNSFDKAPAPKGKYLLDIFDRGTSRQTESGLTDIALDKEERSLTTTTTYAGRIFYSGVLSSTIEGDNRSPNYSNYIFFSKTVENKNDLAVCYQEADPTSEYISDIIDTDGGTITIPEANRIFKLVPLRNSLVVFSENGIWELFGSEFGFKATDYQLNKITNVGISNPKAVVVAGDIIAYWTKSGIYVISVEPTSGRLVTQNVSLNTIHTFYNNLSTSAKSSAKGYYDEKESKVRWLYSEDTNDEYHKELVLDLSLQAFYPNSISRETISIADYVNIPNYVNTITVEDVYVGADQVLVGTDVVQVNSTVQEDRDSTFSFLSFTDTGFFSLAKYSNTSFVDWEVEYGTGVDYNSYIVTGYEIFGDILRKKQATYLVAMFERTETGFELSGSDLVASNPSSCLVQAQWNWTNSATSGKWGTQFQAYRYNRKYIPSGTGDTYNTGDKVIVSRNKLRGSGRALSLYFQSETGKDMKIIGWAIPMSGTGAA